MALNCLHDVIYEWHFPSSIVFNVSCIISFFLFPWEGVKINCCCNFYFRFFHLLGDVRCLKCKDVQTFKEFFIIICFIRLPLEFLPALGLTERWCTTTLGETLLISSRVGSSLHMYMSQSNSIYRGTNIIAGAKSDHINSSVNMP